MSNPSKPTALKKAQGTFRKDRAQPNEPTFKSIKQAKNLDELDEDSLEVWNHIFPILSEQKVVTQADEDLLLEYCWLIAKLKYVKSKLQNEAFVSGPNLTPSNYFKIYDSLFDKMLKISSKFGLNPSDRTRLNVPEPEKKPKASLIVRAGGK